MKPIIEVNNVSKSFIIAHEGSTQGQYTALRDVMAHKAKKLFSFASSMRANKPSPTKEEFWALKDVNFSILPGDRVGIIGRNGAGKSTLLKILSRITEPSSGEIRIRGRVASLLEVGTGFHPELTGRENIYLNGAILGMSRAEIKRKFDEIVDFAEVEKFLDTPVKRYSSGMYVRLAFAVAAHLEPEILIVDEVLAVGDAQFQKKCLGKMEDVSKNEGRTVLFVSHQLDALQRLCSQSIYLKEGKVMQKGNTKEVIPMYFNSLKQEQYKEIDIFSNIKVKNLLVERNESKYFFTISISNNSDKMILSVIPIIYTRLSQRICLFDLRKYGFIAIKKQATITLSIDTLIMVSGNYYLGLCIETSLGWEEITDFIEFSVDEKRSDDILNEEIIPYSSSIRGIINLGYDVNFKITSNEF